MKNNILYLLSLFLCTSFLHTAEIKKDSDRNIQQTKLYASRLQSSLINKAGKKTFPLNLKAVPLTFATSVYVIHSVGIGSTLISQPFALLGAAFFGTILLYPQSTKDMLKKTIYYCSKNCTLETYRLTDSYLRFRSFSQN